MRKIISLVAILFLMASVMVVNSDARDTGYPARGDVHLQSAQVNTASAAEGYGHVHVTTGPALVYRITLTSTSANTYAVLIDSATTGSYADTKGLIGAKGAATQYTGNKSIKADVGAATANQTYVYDFDPPIRCNEGILFGIDTGTGDASTAFAGATAVIEYTSAE